MFGSQLWAVLLQFAPLVIAWITGDQKTRAEAMNRFEGWVAQHKSDANRSVTLRDSARAQVDDLAAKARARDLAAAQKPADAPAANVAPSAKP